MIKNHILWLHIQYQEWKFYLESINDTKSKTYIYARNSLNYISKQLK